MTEKMHASLDILPFIFLTIAFSIICWYYFKSKFFLKKFPSSREDIKLCLKILTGPLLEDLSWSTNFFKNYVYECQQFLKEGICVIWLFHPQIVVISEEFNKILSSDSTLIDRTDLHEMFKPLHGNSLAGTDGDVWRNKRKMMLPAFAIGALKCKMHIYNQNAKILVKQFEDFQDIPIVDTLIHLKECTFKMTAESIFGVCFNDDKDKKIVSEFIDLSDKINQDVCYMLLSPWYFLKDWMSLIPPGRRFLKRCLELRKWAKMIMENMKKSYNSSKSDNIDPLDKERLTLTQIFFDHLQKDPTFTTEDIQDIIIQTLIAGYDTTALTLMWCLYLLGHHPEVQEKGHQEIISEIEGEVAYDHLCKLKYIDCIMKETQRLYPVAPFYGRKATKDKKIGKYEIRKGSEVIIFTYMIHRNPDVYPNPDKFDPDRFLDSSKISPWSHVPFAEGSRNCIGKRIALIEMKVALIHVLRHFEIRTLNKIEDFDWKLSPLLTPTKPISMVFSKRNLVQ